MAYFKANPDSGVTRPDQIAIVGDRLSTDIMMANLMGSYGFWVRDGVTRPGFVRFTPFDDSRNIVALMRIIANNSQLARVEDRLQRFLFRRGYSAPDPAAHNQFE